MSEEPLVPVVALDTTAIFDDLRLCRIGWMQLLALCAKGEIRLVVPHVAGLAAHDLAAGPAQSQGDGIAVAAAAPAGVALRGACQGVDVEQRRAIHGSNVGRLQIPSRAVHLEMHRCQAREQRENAGDRAQVAAPHTFAPAIDDAHGNGCHR